MQPHRRSRGTVLAVANCPRKMPEPLQYVVMAVFSRRQHNTRAQRLRPTGRVPRNIPLAAAFRRQLNRASISRKKIRMS